MKSSLLKLALVAAALCAPVVVQAQTATTTPDATAPDAATKPAKMGHTPYRGVVKSIDASSLVVTTPKGDLTLAISPKTKVKVDKKVAQVTDITVGEKVTGSYTTDDSGAMTAASIHGSTK